MRAYDQDNLWPLVLFALFFACAGALAFALTSRRDVGRGLIPPRPGPAGAAPSLLSPHGLVWRLQRGVFIAWLVGIAAYGSILGGISNQLEDVLADVGGAAELIARIGGAAILIDAFFATIVGVMSQVVAVFTIQMAVRMRSEEAGGPLEAILATATTRRSWLMSYVGLTALGTLALLFFAGLATGLFADLAGDGGWSRTPALVEATLAHVPAVLVLGGLAVAAFGFVPRWAAAIAWLAYAIALVTGPLIGQLLDLPRWARNISPFTHSPNLPAADADAVPVVVLLLVAALLTVAGFLGFRRRDIARQ